MNPIPFEIESPELGRQLQLIVEGKHVIKTANFTAHGNFYSLHAGQVIVKRKEANSICGCGSGKKYKKCCGK